MGGNAQEGQTRNGDGRPGVQGRSHDLRRLLLFADEPTGNLDGTNGALVADLLFDLVRDSGAALVMVTHDDRLAARADRIVTMRDGQVVAPVQASA